MPGGNEGTSFTDSTSSYSVFWMVEYGSYTATLGPDAVGWRIASYPLEIIAICGESRGECHRDGHLVYVYGRDQANPFGKSSRQDGCWNTLM